MIAYFIFHHCLINNNRSGVKLATNHRHSSLGFALRIRQHQTLLCVIRLSQTASPVAGAWSFYFILSLPFFFLFHFISSLRQSLHCDRVTSQQNLHQGNCFNNCWGYKNVFSFLLVLYFMDWIFFMFVCWKVSVLLRVFESEKRVVRSEWHFMMGKLKLRVWLKSPVRHFSTQQGSVFLVKS